jgi:hypothetical protein
VQHFGSAGMSAITSSSTVTKMKLTAARPACAAGAPLASLT